MINKKCFLTNKGKLYVILHGGCKYMNLNHFMCEGCVYFTQKAKKLKLQRLQELKEDMSFYHIDLEKELVAILSQEIKNQQNMGYIKEGIYD